MNNLWLKIKIWTKVTVFSLLLLYGLVLIFKNSTELTVWVWINKTYDIPAFFLMILCVAVGVVGTLLVRTVLKTIRQLREMRDRNLADKEAREMADMKSKAAMLHTRPDANQDV